MKKSRNIQLDIPKPCHQNWDDMTPAEQGRHCKSCNKVVTDFSNYTDKELALFFKSKPNCCGRFDDNQLNRIITLPVEHNSSFLQKALLGGALVAGLTPTISAQVASANTDKRQAAVSLAPVDKPKEVLNRTVISGTVVNAKTKEGVKYIGISIAGTNYKAETDSSGRFSFKVPDEFKNKTVTLEIHEYPFAESSTKIRAGKNTSDIKISLKKQTPKRRKYTMGRTLVCPSF